MSILVLSKLCVATHWCIAFSTVVSRQLDLKQYLALSSTNYVIGAFDQRSL